MSLDSSSNFFGGMFKIQQVPLMCQLGKDKQKQTGTNAMLRQITCCFRTLKSNRRKIKDVITIVFPSHLVQTSPLFTFNNFVHLFLVRVFILGFKSPHNPDNVLPANGALCELLAAVGAGGHVAALEHHAIDSRVPTDLAQVLVFHCIFL